jgi:hypothetical protein
VLPSLDIVHIVTKPVVAPEFLQDWLKFLCHEQGFKVNLFYSDDAFRDDDSGATLAERFAGVKLHRIEKVSCHGAKDQAFVFLADYLDLRYLSKVVTPAIVHTHDTRSLLLARLLFADAIRLHSWWLEDRSAHRLWRVSVERIADYRTWETTEAEPELPEVKGPLASLVGRQIPLPTPETLSDEPYSRGSTFETVRELYRTILRDVDLRAKV